MRARYVLAPVALGFAFAAAHRYRNWGATPAERLAVLDGDEMVHNPAQSTTLAVTVNAPAEQAWQWLVQIGQDRAGLYSYERLENLFGLHIHNADSVHPEWQDLAVGDIVRLAPPRWLGVPDGLGLPVAKVVPGRSIVLRMEPPDMPWDAIWSFHVIPLADDQCRLISRSRSRRPSPLLSALTSVFDPVTVFMTRKMLLGLKHRTEWTWYRRPSRELVESS